MIIALNTARKDWVINILALGSVSVMELITTIALVAYCYRTQNGDLVLLWASYSNVL
jgi:hypothetical protein